jgi:plastocyanin
VKKAATIFVAAAFAAFGVAACGSSSDNSSETTAASTTPAAPAAAAGASIDVSADPSGAFAFNTDSITAKPGPTTVNFDNPASLSHDLVIDSADGKEVGRTDLIAQNKASFTADLKPGTYTYFCDVPGHEEGGMKGTLTVK